MSGAIGINDQSLKALAGYLETGFMCADPQKRRQAETFLAEQEKRPGYGLLVLTLVSMEQVGLPIRQAGAVNFKNYIKKNWTKNTINDEEASKIKSGIIDLMLKSPDRIQRQLSEATTIIAQTDFPAQKWNDLLPQLVQKMNTTDFAVLIGVLRTASSIFERYRRVYRSDAVLLELQFVLKVFARPLQDMFLRMTDTIEKNGQNEKILRSAFYCVELMVQMYRSLHCIDLPEFFEDNMDVWFGAFFKYLNYTPQGAAGAFLLEDPDNEEEPTVFHKLLGEIIGSINLYIQKYEEEFEKYIGPFVKSVWALLMKCTNESRYDPVVTNALSFLTTCAKSVHHALFGSADSLHPICVKIIIPHMRFRDIDEDTFTDNPTEYIRCDFEGSNADTRRRACSELVKGLRKNYEEQVTQIFSSHINNMLQEYKSDPKKRWKSKDVAIYLLSALAMKSGTKASGVLEVNPKVPIAQFYSSQIAPELVQYPNNHVVLQADALRFTAQFRHQLPPTMLESALPHVARMLTSNNYVVHSYAGLTLDRLLSMRAPSQSQSTPTSSSSSSSSSSQAATGPLLLANSFKPMIESILKAVFGHLDTKQSKENPHLMRVVLRIIKVTSATELFKIIKPVLEGLTKKLLQLSANPSNPHFNHLMFDSIAGLIQSLCNKDASAVTSFESSLLGVFQKILEKDVQEFLPYVFQILAQMMVYGEGIRKPYQQIFGSLLEARLWEETGNVTALVRLLRSYMLKDASFVKPHLQPVLGIFQKLISSRTKDHEGFALLEAITQYFPTSELQPVIVPILQVLFVRYSSSKTVKYTRLLIVWLSFLIGVHGVDFSLQALDATQPKKNFVATVLEKVILPNVKSVCGMLERKMCVIACSKLLAECPQMLQAPLLQYWSPLLLVVMEILELPEEDANAEEVAEAAALVQQVIEESSAGPTFNALSNTSDAQKDPFEKFPHPKEYLARALTTLSEKNPGKLGAMIKSALPSDASEVLFGYFKIANCNPRL